MNAWDLSRCLCSEQGPHDCSLTAPGCSFRPPLLNMTPNFPQASLNTLQLCIGGCCLLLPIADCLPA